MGFLDFIGKKDHEINRIIVMRDRTFLIFLDELPVAKM